MLDSEDDDSESEDPHPQPVASLVNHQQLQLSQAAANNQQQQQPIPPAAEFVKSKDLDPTPIPFTGQPGIKIRNTQGLTPWGYLKLFMTTTILQTIVLHLRFSS